MAFGLAVCCLSLGSASCSENVEENPVTYTDWTPKNEAAYKRVMQTAKKAIAKAKEEHGAAWKEHCNYRFFRAYDLAEGAEATYSDTICVRIDREGKGTESPLFTDSVVVNYMGQLMPTAENPKGHVFDKTGLLADSASVFDPQTAAPRGFHVSEVVKGMSTALQQMKVGSLWRVYIPAEMGYGQSSKIGIPAGSMLIFELELVRFKRK